MKKYMINIDDNEICIHESGGKELEVLLIHGNSLSSKSYKKQLEESIGKNYHLVAVDLPGHGDSLPAKDPKNLYSFPGYAKTLISVINKLNLSSVVLVGHSLGGHIALEISASLSGVKGIFIFGTPPLGVPPDINQAFLDMTLNPSTLFKAGSKIPQFFEEDFASTDPDARKFMIRNTVKNKFTDEIEIVSQLKIPLAVIHGMHDKSINLEYIKKIQMPTLWKNKVHIIQNAGHTTQWETPEEFNSLLETFLRELN
jgi:pimeloyl-ACP methyl ester carboxylesterase